MSSKGQLPFVELNGKEIADSNFVIAELEKHFNKETLESHLNPEQKAQELAFEYMLEESLFWVMVYFRAQDINTAFFSQEAMGAHIPSFINYTVGPLLSCRFGSTLKTKLYNQGMGRHTPEDVETIGKKRPQGSFHNIGQ